MDKQKIIIILLILAIIFSVIAVVSVISSDKKEVPSENKFIGEETDTEVGQLRIIVNPPEENNG